VNFSFTNPEWSFAVKVTGTENHNPISIDMDRIAGKSAIYTCLEFSGCGLELI